MESELVHDEELEQPTSDLVQPITGANEDGILPTDIVFDCVHCGHSLAIDYRGAGLTINCVECGQAVEVPIPAGMKLGDLDLDPSEVMEQLIQTRNLLQKSERSVAELEEALNSVKLRRAELEKGRMATLHRCAELSSMSQAGLRLQNELTTLFNRMLTLIAEIQQR